VVDGGYGRGEMSPAVVGCCSAAEALFPQISCGVVVVVVVDLLPRGAY